MCIRPSVSFFVVLPLAVLACTSKEEAPSAHSRFDEERLPAESGSSSAKEPTPMPARAEPSPVRVEVGDADGATSVRFPLQQFAPEQVPGRVQWSWPEGTLTLERNVERQGEEQRASLMLRFVFPDGAEQVMTGRGTYYEALPIGIDTETLHLADFDGDGRMALYFRFLYGSDWGYQPGAWIVLEREGVVHHRLCGGGEERFCMGCAHPSSGASLSPNVLRLALDLYGRHRPPMLDRGLGRDIRYQLDGPIVRGVYEADWYYNEDCGSLNFVGVLDREYGTPKALLLDQAFGLVLTCAERPPSRRPMTDWCDWLARKAPQIP